MADYCMLTGTPCSPSDYYLYLMKNAVIVLITGSVIESVIIDIFEDNIALENGQNIKFSQINNLYFCGRITDYKKNNGYGIIENDIHFLAAEESAKNILPLIFYGEYTCRIAAHLYKNEGSSNLYAKDLILLEKAVHVNYKNILGLKVELETTKGDKLVGRVARINEESFFLTRDGEMIQLNFSEVARIAKAVDLNDEICIYTRQHEKVKGKVVTVSESQKYIILNNNKTYYFDEVEDIDFISRIIRFTSLHHGLLDGKYYFSNRFFVDRDFQYNSKEYNFLSSAVLSNPEKAEVYFKIGFSDQNMVAKFIHIDQANAAGTPMKEELGVIVHYDMKSAHISKSYIEGGIANKATAVFFPRVIKPDFDYNYDYIYVVKYRKLGSTVDPKGNPYDTVDPGFGIQLVDSLPRGLYKQITIDATGEVKKIEFSDSDYLEGMVQFINGARGGIIDKNGREYAFLLEAVLNGRDYGSVNPDRNRYIVRFLPCKPLKFTSKPVARAITITKCIPVQQTRKAILGIYMDRNKTAYLSDSWTNTKKFEGTVKLTNIDLSFLNLDTFRNVYVVSYVLDYNSGWDSDVAMFSVLTGQREITIENICSRNDTESITIVDNEVQITLLQQEEENSIASEAVETESKPQADDMQVSSPYEYGLVHLCFGSKLAIISKYYRNKSFLSSMEEAIVDARQLIFHPFEAQLDFKMNTGKYAYLVKFVPGGKVVNPRDGSEIDTIDYSYPVLLEERFIKKQYAGIYIDGATVIRKAGYEENPQTAESEIPQEYSKLYSGEDVFLVYMDDRIDFVRFTAENEYEFIADGGNRISKKEIKVIYRTGIITGYDLSIQEGYLNGFIPFDLSTVELKTLNILKTNKDCSHGSLHVIYRSDLDAIREIKRIPQNFLDIVKWTPGKVTSCTNSTREVIMNDRIRHCLSVLSDGYICRLFNQKKLTGMEVFMREASHPFLEENGEMVCIPSAIDVHSVHEEAVIRYNTLKDIYLAYRNQTYSYAITGDTGYLQTVIDQTILVHFIRDNAGKILNAFPAEADNKAIYSKQKEEEAANEESLSPNMLCNSLLGKYHLEQAAMYLKQLLLSKKDILLNEEGYPSTREQAQKAANWLSGVREFTRYTATAFVMLHSELKRAGAPPKTAVLFLEEAFYKHIEDVINDPNGLYGDYAYYISSVLHCSRLDNTLLYYLFAQDFFDRYAMPAIIRGKKKEEDVTALFYKECSRTVDLIGHLFLLDKNSFEMMRDIIRHCPELSEQLSDYIRKTYGFDSGLSFTRLCNEAKTMFEKERSRLIRKLQEKATDPGAIRTIALEGMELADSLFLKFICRDDSRRFNEFKACCTIYGQAAAKADFASRERGLLEALRLLRELENTIRRQPTKEALEILLLQTSILERINASIRSDLNSLYKKSVPHIECQPNENEVRKDAQTIYLILENKNRSFNSEFSLQPGRNLSLELFSTTFGVQIEEKPELPGRTLNCGEDNKLVVPVNIDFSALDSDSIVLNWSLQYDYYTGFDQEPQVLHFNDEHTDNLIQILIQNGEESIKPMEIENPYKRPAIGDPLTGRDMFFGRENEISQIWKHIVTHDNHCIPGRAVIIYGQKKCGKTSLVNQIENRIVQEMNEKAIIIKFGDMLEENGNVSGLQNFNLCFYHNILEKFKREIRNNHREVKSLLDSELRIPDVTEKPEFAASLFYSFFENFRDMDQNRHPIVLIMDEFTRFCTAVKEHLEYHTIPNFIKKFSQLGFIQIVIGHDSMIRTLGYLGTLNHTAEFAKQIEISALEERDARSLIIEPMKEKYGFDVYNTILGEMAIDELLQLSGCSPCYLMRLCDKVFDSFTQNTRKKITTYDIETTKNQYISELKSDDFDILLMEDGDGAQDMENRSTFQYLKAISMESANSVNHDCDADTVCEEIGAAQSRETQRILESRRVIKVKNGRINIIVGLFREYIIRKFGRLS